MLWGIEMKIVEGIKDLIRPKEDILFIEDNRSLAECVVEMIRKLDFEPKLNVKVVYNCPCHPWVVIENGCYKVNGLRASDRFDTDILEFQIAFGAVRMRAQEEDSNLLLFTPEFSTGIPVIDQKISEVYFDNFDNKKETDRSISAWILVRFYIEDFCPVEEYSKLAKLGADKFIKFKVSKEKKVVIE